MNSVVSLIVKPSKDLLDTARKAALAVLARSAQPLREDSLSDSEALDIYCTSDNRQVLAQSLAQAMAGLPVDLAVQPIENRRRTLLVADMDSTMIATECVDELADFAGVKSDVAAITDAAMRGELDFEASLKKRVALLRGLDEGFLERCFEERVLYMPGAETLIKTMRAHGAYTVLVSGGFTYFTERVAAALGFHEHKANTLVINAGRLTGAIVPPVVTADTKRQTLMDLISRLDIAVVEAMAVGDGANDIPMLQAAGLGIAYHAKPATEEAAHISIRHTDLRALLFLQGYRQDEFTDTLS